MAVVGTTIKIEENLKKESQELFEVWTGVVEIFVGCVIFAYNIVYFCSCGVPFLPAIVPLEKAREWDKEEEEKKA